MADGQLTRIYSFKEKLQIALFIEIGMQNVGQGVALTTYKHFQPGITLPSTLFAFWFILTVLGITRYLIRKSNSP